MSSIAIVAVAYRYLRVRLMQAQMVSEDEMAAYTFRCPNLGCEAQYAAIPKDEAPDVTPRCIDCATPFMQKYKGRFVHYQPLRFD
jgi:hypothetical protein